MIENEFVLATEDMGILRNCVEKYGKTHQVEIAIEEMSELTKALIKERRAYYDNDDTFIDSKELDIAEEMADVYIMLLQLGLVFDNHDSVKYFFQKKVKRESDRLKRHFGDLSEGEE